MGNSRNDCSLPDFPEFAQAVRNGIPEPLRGIECTPETAEPLRVSPPEAVDLLLIKHGVPGTETWDIEQIFTIAENGRLAARLAEAELRRLRLWWRDEPWNRAGRVRNALTSDQKYG